MSLKLLCHALAPNQKAPPPTSFPHNKGTSEKDGIKIKVGADGHSIIQGEGVTALVPPGIFWSLQRDHNGLTEGSSDDPLGTLSVDGDNVRFLVQLLEREQTTILRGIKDKMFEDEAYAKLKTERRECSSILKQLYRIAEALKLKDVYPPEEEFEPTPQVTAVPVADHTDTDESPVPLLPNGYAWVVKYSLVGVRAHNALIHVTPTAVLTGQTMCGEKIVLDADHKKVEKMEEGDELCEVCSAATPPLQGAS